MSCRLECQVAQSSACWQPAVENCEGVTKEVEKSFGVSLLRQVKNDEGMQRVMSVKHLRRGERIASGITQALRQTSLCSGSSSCNNNT
jgi:hypothetical protein